MEYLVTAEEMRYYDNYTIEKVGIPAEVLMERAALAALRTIQQLFSEHNVLSGTVLIMAGVGNNGGDGLALARMLSEEGFEVELWNVGNPERASAQWKLQNSILGHYRIKRGSIPSRNEYTVMVDALFGTGLSREVCGRYLEAVELFGRIKGYKLSLDVPSGVDSDTGKIWGSAVRADETVTFGLRKRGLYFYPGCEMAGKITIAEIGIASEAIENRKPGMFQLDGDFKEMLPKRVPWGNKGTFGKVLLVAGRMNMAGAAIMAGKAAYRIGAGMVKVLTASQNREILQISVPEALCGSWDDLQNSLEWADVIAFGPGMGTGEEAKALLMNLVIDTELPLIIDADGLNLIAKEEEIRMLIAEKGKKGRSIVLTPHMGELARLLGVEVTVVQQDVLNYGRKLTEELHAVLVAKDARTLIMKEDLPVCMNISGNSGMATAGSGDVLCGVIAGLMAQGMDDFHAAALGAYYHGKAGEAVTAKIGEYACMAGDLIR